MKHNIKLAALKVGKHVQDHKFAYAAVAVAIGAVALQQRNLKEFYVFLETKGIDPMEFYCPEMYEELNA